MPDQNPADTLRAAAARLRVQLALPFELALANWLESAAEDFQMCERINSRDPHNDGKTRVMPHHLAAGALAVARALLDGVTE